MKEILKGMPLEALERRMEALGESSYRGRQLFRWVNQKKANSFEEMTDLGKAFRAMLAEHFELPSIRVAEEHASNDGTVKYLVELHDGERVESVFIPKKDRNTLCVSTQVGCKMACKFCATGYAKFTRNLAAWEIVDQLLTLKFPGRVTNIVLMGMGEPFDNYDAIVDALKIFQDPNGPQIGKRHITVSTVGLTPRLQQFMDADLGRIAISLHGTTDEQRGSIMPVNKKHPIDELLATCRNLKLKSRERITFEYILIEGINDQDEDARRLAKILRGIPSKINLLAYNENTFVPFKRPSEDRVLSFQAILLDAGYTATYRRSRGRDIAAACGQLHHESKTRLDRIAKLKNITPVSQVSGL